VSLTTLALATLALVLPGIGICVAAYPPRAIDPALRVALVLPFGFAVIGLSSVTLALVGWLSAESVLAVAGAATIAAWAVAVRRGLRAQLAPLVDEVRGQRVDLGVGLAVLIGMALIRLRYSPLANFDWYGPWRYWTDGQDIASAGRVPHHTLQWGAVYSPTVNKVILNAFNGAMGYLLGDTPLPAMGALLFLATMAMAIALWALARELGLRRCAPLLPLSVMVITTNPIRADLGVYTAENWGRAIAFAALALGVRAVRNSQRWRYAVPAGVLFGTALATHMIPALICLLFLSVYALGWALLDRDLRQRALRLGAVLATAVVVVLPPLLLAGSSAGFQGASSNDYQAFPARLDPTASLEAGETRLKRPKQSGFFVTPAQIVERYVNKAGFGRSGVWAAMVTLAALLLAAAMALRLPRPLRPIAPAVVLMGVVLVAVAAAFSYRYDTLVPADFGGSRLFDYAELGTTLVVLALAEALSGWLAGRRSWLPYAALVAAVAVAAVVASPMFGPKQRAITNGNRALTLVNWVRDNTPCDARILPDRITLGTFNATTGRVSVLEGMGPYLRPDMLHTVLTQVLGANAFFRDPAAHRDYLAQQGVDYVILVTGIRVGSMKTHLGQGIDRTAFQQAPFLRQVAHTRFFTVYRVTGLAPANPTPDPRDYPWYRCGRGSLPRGSQRITV
jgi:hypothetical protein